MTYKEFLETLEELQLDLDSASEALDLEISDIEAWEEEDGDLDDVDDDDLDFDDEVEEK